MHTAFIGNTSIKHKHFTSSQCVTCRMSIEINIAGLIIHKEWRYLSSISHVFFLCKNENNPHNHVPKTLNIYWNRAETARLRVSRAAGSEWESLLHWDNIAKPSKLQGLNGKMHIIIRKIKLKIPKNIAHATLIIVNLCAYKS